MKKITLALLMIFTMLVFTGCAKTIEVSYSSELNGLDSRGEFAIWPDQEKCIEDLLDKKIITQEELAEYENTYPDNPSKSYKKVDNILNLISSASIEADKTEELSNGDVVNLDLGYNKELAKEVGYELKLSDSKYTVEGLKEPKIISSDELFEQVEVEFFGVSPNLSLQVLNNHSDEVLSSISFNAKDNDSGKFKIGDKVEIEASLNDGNLINAGYIVEEATKTYTVKDADKYITSFSDIPQASLDQLFKNTSDVVNSEIRITNNEYIYKKGSYYTSTNKAESVSNLRIDDIFFFKAKDSYINKGKNKYYNTIFICYKFDLNNVSGEETLKDVNTYVWYPNLILNKDGTVNIDTTSLKKFSRPEMDYHYFKELVVNKNLMEYEVTEHKFTESE